MTLNTVNIRTKDFSWTSDLNLAFNRSKVISLETGQNEKTFAVGGNRSGTVTYYAVVGQKLGDMYGYIYDGVYTTDDFIQDDKGNFSLREGVVVPVNSKGKLNLCNLVILNLQQIKLVKMVLHNSLRLIK